MKKEYGICSKCGSELMPIWFTEEETKVVNGMMYKTGKMRTSLFSFRMYRLF